ncbi:MAG TPA: NAD-dependent epimerase/dehydratase family protein [Polyangiaceae bacterium]|nr:NAD-dependent epimerase/dehydratase family protein [Polyangiaceae bacterium]
MKLWVTGASGFIGRHLVAQAALTGHQVCAVARRGASQLGDASVRRLTMDLDNHDEVLAHVRSDLPDAIVHLAWYAQPDDYLVSVENLESLKMTLTFARAVLAGGCRRMVGVGTCVEYANLHRPRNEDDPLEPKSLYARTKHAAHLVLDELFARANARLAWARLFHMHGPGEHPTRLIPAVAASLRAGRPFALSPGEQVRDHLDVRDVASALLHLAGSDLTGPVNVCSGKPVTLRTVLETVGRELDKIDLLQFGARPYSATEVMFLAGDPARLLASGWRAEHADLAASLRDTIAGSGTTRLSSDGGMGR